MAKSAPKLMVGLITGDCYSKWGDDYAEYCKLCQDERETETETWKPFLNLLNCETNHGVIIQASIKIS